MHGLGWLIPSGRWQFITTGSVSLLSGVLMKKRSSAKVGKHGIKHSELSDSLPGQSYWCFTR